MATVALISDIHSNIEALAAVMEDMEQFSVDRTYCLGDVIGYGPNPRETLEMVKGCAFILQGNHEEGLLVSAEDFNERARGALEWTRGQLNSADHPKADNYALWDFIDGFEREKVADGHLFVHGSPRNPTREYVMPADALDKAKMDDIFAHSSVPISFGGHTHVPGIFEQGALFRHQSELPSECPLPKGMAMINIGSVGQPRDGDPRASYVIVKDDVLLFRRVAYDVDKTIRKILAVDEIDDFLARRLKSGR